MPSHLYVDIPAVGVAVRMAIHLGQGVLMAHPSPSRLRKKSVPVEIGGIFGDTKPSPATFLALLGQLCAICFSRFLAQPSFSATCYGTLALVDSHPALPSRVFTSRRFAGEVRQVSCPVVSEEFGSPGATT